MKLKLLFSDSKELHSWYKEALIETIIKYDKAYRELLIKEGENKCKKYHKP